MDIALESTRRMDDATYITAVLDYLRGNLHTNFTTEPLYKREKDQGIMTRFSLHHERKKVTIDVYTDRLMKIRLYDEKHIQYKCIMYDGYDTGLISLITLNSHLDSLRFFIAFGEIDYENYKSGH